MSKSNSCYTEYLLKMGISEAVQYNTVLQFSRAQNQYHILERPLLNIDIFVFFPPIICPAQDKPDVTYGGFGWGFLEGFCLLE